MTGTKLTRGGAIRMKWRGGTRGQYVADFRRYHSVLTASDPSRTGLYYPLGPDRQTAKRKLVAVKRDFERRLRKHQRGLRSTWKSTETFKAMASKFLERWIRKAAQRRPRTPKAINWLENTVLFRIGEHFGWDRNPRAITPDDVAAWLDELMTSPGPTRRQREGRKRREGGLSAHQCNHHLAALHMFFQYMTPGYNPVPQVAGRPQGNEEDVDWLPHDDVATLLAASFEVERAIEPTITGSGCLAAYVHTLFLTGCRVSEARVLELRDIDLDEDFVHFRPNSHRRFMKTKASTRAVPLWPQLRDVLAPHIERRRTAGATDTSLLFVQPDGSMFSESVTNGRTAGKGAWAALLAKAELDVLPKGARHSYVAQRLQTLDGGHPVSMYTVSREVGHGDEKMVSRVYAKLGKVRVRTEGVSFYAPAREP